MFVSPAEGSPSSALDPDPASSGQLLLLLLQETGILLDPAALTLQIALLIFLLLASAFFSGSEVALFSAETSADSVNGVGESTSRQLTTLLDQPQEVLVSILLLKTLSSVGATITAAVLVLRVAVAMGWNQTWTIVAEMIVLAFVLLVVAEISPRLIASRNVARARRFVAGPLLALHRLIAPLSRLLTRISSGVQQRIAARRSHHLSTDDLRSMAEIGEAHGTLEEEERDLIHSIVEFGETTVREVMVSRLDVVALPTSATLNEALEVIQTSGHSRLPLYVEHLDNILGIVYAKDLIPYLSQIENGAHLSTRPDWTRQARPPMFVPLGKKLDDLLRDFQARKTHLAIVVDEYGGTAGLVTLEDLLEEIVGEIRDEHDEEELELFEQIDDQSYRFDARIDLDELNEVLGVELDTEAFDFETLGGLIYHVTGEIPTEGEEITYNSLLIRVETIESNRIGKAIVRVVPVDDRETVEERREA